MKNPELFIKAMNTMLHSWGGDTPPEALWALTEFVEWINSEYNLHLSVPTEGDYYNDNKEFDKQMQTLEIAIGALS